MSCIEEIRNHIRCLRAPHAFTLHEVDLAILDAYKRAPADLEFLLAEVDHLQSCAIPAIAWTTDDEWAQPRKVATVGEIILTWWPYNQAWCIGTAEGALLAGSKDEDRKYNGGNAGQRACEAAYYKVIGLKDHPPLSAVEAEYKEEE